MQVQRISNNNNYNTSNRQNFTAKFPQREIVSMAEEAKKTYGAAGIPMLDILLGYLEKIGGKSAHIEHIEQKKYGINYKVLVIDEKDVYAVGNYNKRIDLLKKYLVGQPAYNNVRQDFILMPESVFESRWFEQGTRDEKALLTHAL